jgi:hypothetical protein
MKSLFAPLLLVFIADFLAQFKTRCSMRFVDQPPILERRAIVKLSAHCWFTATFIGIAVAGSTAGVAEKKYAPGVGPRP